MYYRKQDEQRLTTAEMKFIRTARYSPLGHTRNEHIMDKLEVTPITEYVNYRQIWLQRKKNGQSQDSKTKFSTCPHWTTTARKTEEKMAGDRNMPLGLILE
jgi:hypothetical protein